ncbi:MAG: pyrroline-5-carboxylate reductase [Lentisphaerae bacterium GWF2_45_14]|nr:MAG: pyrroline-5-carboxylate reductase [Lentisphaerae bacterium GWF2_45_14]
MQINIGNILVIGAGRMATSMVAGMLEKGIRKNQISAIDKSDGAALSFFKATGIDVLVTELEDLEAKDLLEKSSFVIIAVKPQNITDLSTLYGGFNDKTIMSIVAGVSIEKIQEITAAEKIIRVMPNIPALVRAGISAYCCSPKVGPEDIENVEAILSMFGSYCALEEKHMNAVTGLSGSGPAYVFEFIQALADGGVNSGLPRDAAMKLAVETIIGSAKMLIATNLHPAILRDQVFSPGGTTGAGLAVLDKGGFRGIVAEAVCAAAQKAEKLGRG